jgi:hypothetical protein
MNRIMGKKEFVEEVKLRCDPSLAPCVEEALEIAGDEFGKDGEYYQADIPTAIERIGKIASHLGKSREPKPICKLVPSPDVLLTSDALIRKITSWTELIRMEIFGSPQPPFRNYQALEGWLQAQAKQVLHAAKLTGLKSLFFFHSVWYFDSKGKSAHVPIYEPVPPQWSLAQERPNHNKFSSINWLQNEVHLMSQATGFSEESLTVFVLMGIEPILFGYEWKLGMLPQETPQGDRIIHRSFTVTFHRADIKFDELRDIYNTYRHELGFKRGKSLKPEHKEIYELVQRKGGPPKDDVIAFWESVKAEWNANHRHHRTTWQGFQRLYNRINETLESRISGKGGKK